MTWNDLLPGYRIPGAEPGPLTDGGWRWRGRNWAVDLDERGRAVCIVDWPSGLTDAAWRKGSRAAAARAEAAITSEVLSEV